MTWGVTFFARSPIVWMMIPQLTEQYGHVLRVSVVRDIFREAVCACSGCRSKPSAESPTAPATPVLRKERREGSIKGSARLRPSTEQRQVHRTCQEQLFPTDDRKLHP